MYGILDEKYVTRNSDGSATANTKGNTIEISKDGSFTIKNRTTGEVIFEKHGKAKTNE